MELKYVIERMLNFVDLHKLFSLDDHVLLAVSGGMDSMTMVALFQAAGLKFSVAHCNFMLRAEASKEDAAFVKASVNQIGVPFYLQEFATREFAEKNKLSIQAAARSLRYGWFEEIAFKNKIAHVATAHHLNDSIESFFININRGTGIRGMRGIPPQRDIFVRPLLCFTRNEIEDISNQHHIAFREDQSNKNEKYLRNRIRHTLMPIIKEILPDFESKMRRVFDQTLRESDLLQKSLSETIDKIVLKKSSHSEIATAELIQHATPDLLLYEILKPHGFRWDQMQVIHKIRQHAIGKRFFSSTHELIIDRDVFILRPHTKQVKIDLLIDDLDLIYETASGTIQFHLEDNSDFDYNIEKNKEGLNFDLIQLPIKIRNWQHGDHFQPLGMGGRSQKLQDFLTNKKISALEREQVLVMTSGEDIIWVIGHRISEQYKVKNNTQKVLIVEIINSTFGT